MITVCFYHQNFAALDHSIAGEHEPKQAHLESRKVAHRRWHEDLKRTGSWSNTLPSSCGAEADTGDSRESWVPRIIVGRAHFVGLKHNVAYLTGHYDVVATRP
jgi:hypothetical protein